MNTVYNTTIFRRVCPVRDKMLVENEMHPPCPPVPSGTECGNIHCVPDGTQGLWNHRFSTNIMCLTAHRLSPNLISTSFVLNKTTSVAENDAPHHANLITLFLLFNEVIRSGMEKDNHLLLRLFCRENKVKMRFDRSDIIAYGLSALGLRTSFIRRALPYAIDFRACSPTMQSF
jgi:hypothetical protein